MANLALSLFDDEPESEQDVAPDATPVPVNFSHPFPDDEKSTATPADQPEPATVFDRALLGPAGRAATLADAHPLAFVAVCRWSGIEHPALEPIVTDQSGARRFEAKPLQRLANLILRGVESDRPEVTPERWREAGQMAPAWWAGLWSAPGNPRRIEALGVLFAIPNGAHLTPAQAGKAKASGMLAGVWDLFLPCPTMDLGDQMCGLWIEMKSQRGALTDDQLWFNETVGGGYAWCVARSWVGAARAILDYLAVPADHPAWEAIRG